MKKIFVTALIAASLVACENADTTDESTVETTETTTSTTTTYTPGEGDVTHRDGKVMVWRNNNWVEADEDVRLDNGVVVYRNGEVKKDNDVVVLRDGEFVNRSGEFFDKTGNAFLIGTVGELFKNLLTISEENNHLIKSKLQDIGIIKARTALLLYDNYEQSGNGFFATERQISVGEKTKVNIQMSFKQFEFNKELSFPFSIPQNYKRK